MLILVAPTMLLLLIKMLLSPKRSQEVQITDERWGYTINSLKLTVHQIVIIRKARHGEKEFNKNIRKRNLEM